MKAFQMSDGIIRDWYTGQPVENFSGICIVYHNGEGTRFITGIDSGERFWVYEHDIK